MVRTDHHRPLPAATASDLSQREGDWILTSETARSESWAISLWEKERKNEQEDAEETETAESETLLPLRPPVQNLHSAMRTQT
jgi:hypothetical protein